VVKSKRDRTSLKDGKSSIRNVITISGRKKDAYHPALRGCICLIALSISSLAQGKHRGSFIGSVILDGIQSRNSFITKFSGIGK